MYGIPFLYSCNDDYRTIPTYSVTGKINAVIEIPAGTNLKNEMEHASGIIKPDVEDGKFRIIKYLPYPLNYGFIGSTEMKKEKGGDGDPLDVIVICESVESGTVLEVIPVGLLLMEDKNELDNKILAIPADKSLRTADAETFTDLNKNYPGITLILEQWFRNYDPRDPKKMNGWKDEKAAVKEIERWRKR
jgi:inorganic pyrophosphatase